MARVRPFAAFRYDRTGRDVTPVVAPPYDVISEAGRVELLARDGHNVVALELPPGPLDPSMPENRYENGARRWHEWKAEGVVVQDAQPAVYALEQHFVVDDKLVRRRAFIVEVGLEPFSAGVILPHERTLPKALGDRFELIKATGANFSQVLGLFDDADGETDALFDEATSGDPVATAIDADGVESRLWAATDLELASRLECIMADKRIFIADGHHRYTTALAYRDMRRAHAAEVGTTALDPAYDSVMMALVNMEDPEIVVMPTHRVANAVEDFDAPVFLAGLERNFVVSGVPDGDPLRALEDIDRPAFLVGCRGDGVIRLASLREDVDLDAAIPLDRSAAWKHLDVAVLQELVLNPLLDIHPDRPETLDRLGFVKDAREALRASAEHDVVFVLRPTRMDQLRAVAVAGETMPQKSTYFYPKLLSGLVFRSAE